MTAAHDPIVARALDRLVAGSSPTPAPSCAGPVSLRKA